MAIDLVFVSCPKYVYTADEGLHHIDRPCLGMQQSIMENRGYFQSMVFCEAFTEELVLACLLLSVSIEFHFLIPDC